MSNRLTIEEVLCFAAHMCHRFGAEIRDKSDNQRMVAVGWFLETLGVMDQRAFMENCSTTIHTTIYTHFKVGDPLGLGLWDQVCIITHECEHVHQAREEGFIHFAGAYLLDPMSRAHYEAEAYRCDLELDFWRTGRVTDSAVAALAAHIRAYACGEREEDYAREFLAMSADTIRAGGVVSTASQVAIDWLQANVPEVGL